MRKILFHFLVVVKDVFVIVYRVDVFRPRSVSSVVLCQSALAFVATGFRVVEE